MQMVAERDGAISQLESDMNRLDEQVRFTTHSHANPQRLTLRIPIASTHRVHLPFKTHSLALHTLALKLTNTHTHIHPPLSHTHPHTDRYTDSAPSSSKRRGIVRVSSLRSRTGTRPLETFEARSRATRSPAVRIDQDFRLLVSGSLIRGLRTFNSRLLRPWRQIHMCMLLRSALVT
jgi:hypothetical protein